MKLTTRFYLSGALLLSSACVLAPRANAATIPDKGDFLVAYPMPKKAEYKELQKSFKDEKVLEGVADGLNDTFALPENITIEFKELGEANAYYDPNTRHISIGYELLEDLQDLFSKTSKDEDVVLDRTIDATIFILFHELGHALINVYDLPTVGKEEDAVDQLSVFILGDSDDPKDADNDNNKMVLDGAGAFLLLADRDEKTLDQVAMWDEHSLSKQRFYNVISLVYGSNPKKFDYLVTKNILPQERAERSEAEYAQVTKAWGRLLEPYIKD